MSEREKNKNIKAENDNQTPEKKMTKYDLKMQRRREEEIKQKKRQKTTRVIGVLVLVLCVCGFGWRAYNNYLDEHGDYVVIGDHAVKKTEYEYYFYSYINSFYNTYGSYLSYFGLDLSESLDSQYYSDTMTWQDYFDEQTVEELKSVYALNDAAEAAGFEYDAADDYNTMIETLQSEAEENDMSLDEYCQAAFGSGATAENIEQYVVDSYTASAYYDSIEEATEITEDEVNTYYDENKDSYDSVDYMICEIDADMPEDEDDESTDETEETEELTEEEQEALEAEQEAAEEAAMAEAEEKANEMLDQITDEASFEELFAEYATDPTTDPLVTNETKSYISPTAVAEWLFDSERQQGDTTVIEYESGDCYYVVYFVDRYLEHVETADIRYIFIEPEEVETTSEDTEDESVDETEETEELTEEEQAALEAEEEAEQEALEVEALAAAVEKANEIHEEWQSGDATEDSFEELTETKSDEDSTVTGGLVEAVADGDLEDELNEWVFDDAREYGDTAVIETDEGCYIIYYVGENNEEWYVNIESTLLSEAMTEYMTSLTEDMEVSDPRNHIAYLHVETETEEIAETEAVDDTPEETEALEETSEETEDVTETE